ncbi:hypothetical protein Glove_300g37 [Diversispora epigaea]|uniref:BTB domain-containing protein n=1 Tax=Diversispora epigaea TaxID=1348612 RepID=A0A397HXX7_9GLOM|nr:hypothetical protein Glove_300g37 [Diversispora epigaea]
MSLKFFDKLSQDFSELLNDKKEYNVIIEVDKEKNKKSFTAHSVVLRYRSSYFDKELENAPTNKKHVKTIIRPNISAQIFEIILKYIYGGIADVENTDTKTIYELMVNTNELELKELSVKLESYLIESKASWLRTHFSRIYHSIFDDFASLRESVLVSILRKDDLKVEEIKIWDYVIKWGIAQNHSLPVNLKEWSNENFATLKVTLQRCLPLIRYFHIPGEDIWEKVKPFKKILDEQLWDDIIQNSISPNKSVKSLVLPARIISNPELPSRTNSTPELPFSTIISKINYLYIPYEFQLILRGSRDGFHPKKFQNMCYRHSRTIVVAKVAETNEIVGDYNPSAWDNSTYNSPIYDVNDSGGGVIGLYTNFNCCPNFGNCEFVMGSNVSDFTQDRGCQCLRSDNTYYEKPIRTSNEYFSIVDYEIHIWCSFLPYLSIFDCNEFEETAFISILQRDDLNIEEIKIWDYVIKWGIAQILLYLLIRKNARIISSFELPSRTISTPEFSFSTIINKEHAAELSSRDGFHPKKFWNMCHGHAGTIVVIKIAGTDEIVGGYNPLALDNSIGDSVWKQMINIYGPNFGRSKFMMKSIVFDFSQDKGCCYDHYPLCNHIYENPIRETMGCFSLVDYEVFKILEK